MQRFPGKFRHTSVVFLSRNQDSDNVSVLWYSPCPVLLPPGFSPAPVSAPAAAPEYNKAGHLLMKDNRLPRWTASLFLIGLLLLCHQNNLLPSSLRHRTIRIRQSGSGLP